MADRNSGEFPIERSVPYFFIFRLHQAIELVYSSRMFRHAFILTVLSLFTGLAFPGAVSEVFFFPQIADGTAGSLTLQTEFIFVNTGEDTAVTLEFFDGSGNPPLARAGGRWAATPPSISPCRRATPLRKRLPAQEILRELSRWAMPVSQRVQEWGPPRSSRTIDATTGIVQSEAGVPATTPLSTFTLFVDSLGNVDTGLAMVKPPVSQEG